MGRHSKPRHRGRTVLRSSRRALPVVAVLAVAGASWSSAGAAFRGTNGNSGNSLSSGTVALSGVPVGKLFDVTGMQPGSIGTRCVTVTYTGTLPAGVRFYATAPDVTKRAINNYLNLTVYRGTDPGLCTTTTPPTALFTGTAAALTSTNGSWASGLGAWPATTGQSSVYRIDYLLKGDDSAENLKTSELLFTWEAQNT